jgi:hypothetical protein
MGAPGEEGASGPHGAAVNPSQTEQATGAPEEEVSK